MGLCARCRTDNPVGAIFCRKCGVQLTAAPQPTAPLSPPQVIYVNQPGVPPRASKTSRFGCGTLILVLVAGCCLWSAFAYFMQDKATIERSTTPPLKQESTPQTPASGWQRRRPKNDRTTKTGLRRKWNRWSRAAQFKFTFRNERSTSIRRSGISIRRRRRKPSGRRFGNISASRQAAAKCVF